MNKWDNLEKAVIGLMNVMGYEIEWVGEQNLCYDGIGKTIKGKDCVIEMKFRTKYYETKMLEKKKYDCLSQFDGVQLYFVADPKGNYLYYLNDLTLPELTIQRCPKTTMWNTNKTDKEIYYLEESQAIKINYNVDIDDLKKSV